MDITPIGSSPNSVTASHQAIAQDGEPATTETGAISSVPPSGAKPGDEFMGGLLEFIRDAQAQTATIDILAQNLEPSDRTALLSALDRIDLALGRPVRSSMMSTDTRPRQIVLSGSTAPGWRWQLRDSPLLLLSLFVAGLWLCIFAAGLSIPAAPYMSVLAEMHSSKPSLGAIASSGALVLFCSTTTNPGLLACLAGILGGLSNLAHIDGRSNDTGDASVTPLIIDCFAPMLRGFFLYLALLAGLLLLTTQAITNATQDQYVQLAGTVSVLAFMVGYDPDVFRKIMGRVNGWASKAEGADVSKTK